MLTICGVSHKQKHASTSYQLWISLLVQRCFTTYCSFSLVTFRMTHSSRRSTSFLRQRSGLKFNEHKKLVYLHGSCNHKGSLQENTMAMFLKKCGSPPPTPRSFLLTNETSTCQSSPGMEQLESCAPLDTGSSGKKGESPCPINRSRAVPIPRKTGESSYAQESIETETQSCYAAQCEMSTWRMYNRITSYRQMHPINAGSSSPQSVIAYLPQDLGGSTFPDFPNLEIRLCEDPPEDEIFDLEL